jgi:NFU1 iron-sulfur cluster scaffold homolog, mitochondrial
MSAEKLSIVAEDTPNPLSNKFSLSRKLLDGPGRDFPYADAAKPSPLAAELFMLPGVTAVYIGPDFVTVTVKPGIDWWSQRPLVIQAIDTHLSAGKPVLGAGEPGKDAAAGVDVSTLSPTEVGIIRVLENEIQPAVAMDGGFIAFSGFNKGIVKVQLRGACHSCPSALVTLKAGIEARLKQEFPDIVGVEAV